MSKLKNLAWNDINWSLVISRVRRIQRRIYKAKKTGAQKRVHWLQKHLINSTDAKLLSVLTVTTLKKTKVLTRSEGFSPNYAKVAKHLPCFAPCLLLAVRNKQVLAEHSKHSNSSACFAMQAKQATCCACFACIAKQAQHGKQQHEGQAKMRLVESLSIDGQTRYKGLANKKQIESSTKSAQVNESIQKRKSSDLLVTKLKVHNHNLCNNATCLPCKAGTASIACIASACCTCFACVAKQSKQALAVSCAEQATALQAEQVATATPALQAKQCLPTVLDRAKQALALLALEPEWEAVFEPNSYGFRPGRIEQDAVEGVFIALSHDFPKFILKTSLRSCIQEIDHEVLLSKLDTFPEMERQVKAWLKSGLLALWSEQKTPFIKFSDQDPNSLQTSQRTEGLDLILPLLVNIALHGIENLLKERVGSMKFQLKASGALAIQKSLTVIRFADELIIIHKSQEILNESTQILKEYLSGLHIKHTRKQWVIKDGRHGFSTLGFTFTQIKVNNRYKLSITPSKESVKLCLSVVADIIKKNKAVSSYALINMCRPVILRWANYFRFCECDKTFRKVSFLIFQKIRAWVFRRDTRHGRMHIKKVYFPSSQTYFFNGRLHKDNWVLVGRNKTKNGVQSNFLPHMSWVLREKHVKVKTTKSPYDGDHVYWTLRKSKNPNLPISTVALLKRQKNCCASCGKHFDAFDVLEVDHIIPKKVGGQDKYANLQLLHRYCHVKKTNLAQALR